MNGAYARLGFRYQDWFLLREALTYLRRMLAVSWEQGSLDPYQEISRCPVKFGVEATTDHLGAQPTWDSLVVEDPQTRVIEIKSGNVSAEDRRTLWRRIRKEVARKSVGKAFPVLVMNPSRFDCEAFKGLAKCAKDNAAASLPSSPPTRVTSDASMLQEARWYLCVEPETQPGTCPPLTASDALDVLRRFQLIELESDRLESEVGLLLEVLFPQLLVETSARLLRGWLDERATTPNLPDRQFSLIQLLEVVGRFDQCATLKPGQLAHWRTLWKELRQQQMARSSCRLGQTGATLQPVESQPTAVMQILQGSSAKNLLLGEGGAGKTTLLNQLACQTPEPSTLLAWADGVSEAELVHLGDSIRFLGSLCSLGVGAGVLNVFVDALEEARAPKRESWARLLSRISGSPHIRILASMREADFRTDSNVRTQLQGWAEVKTQGWSEEIVRSLLTSAGHSQISPKLFQLLQRPILLDLYWRTFVEDRTAARPQPGDVTTRHGLLRAFWLNRLLLCSRHYLLGDVAGRCATVIAAAANTVGDFPETGLDKEAVAALLSEGILIKESGLQSRLRFRHPFLRDFAVAQWCLPAGSAKEIYDRWHSIRSFISRTGALRAMLEALADDSAERDFAHLAITDLISIFLEHDKDFQSELPRALGALAPNQRTNPALWPASIQSKLSASFASQLLTEARHHANTTWAEAIENWPVTASWLPEDFPVEVLNYVTFLAARLQQTPQVPELRQQTLAGARALREMSEQSRFAPVVCGNGRWLKGAILSLVTPLLPDNDTLTWLEREAQQASHRTRECILDILVPIAPVDFSRTANLYRTVVALTETNGAFGVDPAVWGGMMAEHAVGWCLGSHGQKPGLLDRYPAEFLLLAMQVAEALSVPYLAQKRESLKRIRGDIAKAAGAAVTESQEEPSPLPPALIDDRPNYTFWKTRYRTGPYERCLALIYDNIRRLAATNPDVFLNQVAPLLMASRLATVRSFLFDICLARIAEPGFASVLGQALCDSRIYPFSCLAFWIQEGLARAWPSLSQDQRRSVLEHLNSLMSEADRGGAFRRLQYLAAIPQEDLSTDLRSEVEAHRAADNSPFRRPEDFGGASFTAPSDYSGDAERLLGECTPDCRNRFKQFYRQYLEYQAKQNGTEEVVRRLPQLLQVANEVAEDFSRPENMLLIPHGLLWLWSAFESLLADCLNLAKDKEYSIRPPDTFVRRGGEAALLALEGILSLPVLEGGAEETDPPPAWEEALRLANVAMAFDCALTDGNLINRFHAVLKQAAGSPHPGIQRSLLTDIHPWHWQRNSSIRGDIQKLLLEKAQHGEVLKWGLSALDSFPDQERTEIYAKLLQKTKITHADEFIRFFGRYLGAWGIAMVRGEQRSGIAQLVSMLLTDPAQFALVWNQEVHRDLLAGIAGGMEEQVRGSLRFHELIPNFAGWLGQITQKMRQLPRSHAGGAGILSMALHFLEQAERKDSPFAVAKPWWDALYPLLKETVQNGDVDEVWMVLFDQRGGVCSDLSSVDEVCRLVEILLGRIDSGLTAGGLDVNLRNFEQGPRNTWRECSDLAAEWLRALLDAGRVTREHEREAIFGLFQRLSASPLNSEKALSGLHRMQGT